MQPSVLLIPFLSWSIFEISGLGLTCKPLGGISTSSHFKSRSSARLNMKLRAKAYREGEGARLQVVLALLLKTRQLELWGPARWARAPAGESPLRHFERPGRCWPQDVV